MKITTKQLKSLIKEVMAGEWKQNREARIEYYRAWADSFEELRTKLGDTIKARVFDESECELMLSQMRQMISSFLDEIDIRKSSPSPETMQRAQAYGRPGSGR